MVIQPNLQSILHMLSKRKSLEEGELALLDYEVRKRDLPRLYEAICQRYPDDRSSDPVRSWLLAKLWITHDSRTVEFISEVYDSLPANPRTRQTALMVLSFINTRDSLKALRQLLLMHVPQLQDWPESVLAPLLDAPEHTDILFPQLFRLFESDQYRIDIYRLGARSYRAGYLKPAKVRVIRDRIAKDWKSLQSVLSGTRLPWDERDRVIQALSAIVVLMRVFMNDKKISQVVERALRDKYPQIALSGAWTWIGTGRDVDDSVIDKVLSDDSTILNALKMFDEYGMKDRVPKGGKLQEKVARADLVRWLSHPNECGLPPERIHLKECLETSKNRKKVRVYVFEFRYRADREWSVGISGPQPLDDTRYVDCGEWTYSGCRSSKEIDVNRLLSMARSGGRDAR